MEISEAAQRNHDVLFPNHVSTLKVTNPELIALFDNGAFGELLEDTTLDLRTRLMCGVSMLASLGGCEPQLAGHVAANLAIGNERARLLSVLTQLLPFIGSPRTLNALRVFNEGASP